MSDLERPSPAAPGAGGRTAEAARVRWGSDGLVPVVVQDIADGRVLMLAYANAEALAATRATGEIHFYSRSRHRLWRKGETSGNVLRLVDLSLDCDGDTLLARAEPAGPACHHGTRSCFDEADASPVSTVAAVPIEAAAPGPAPVPQGFEWLERLWATIAERVASRPPGSYTARLVSAGVDGPGRKVVEEATEVLMAAKDDAVAEAAGLDRTALRDALAGEAADLLYHALVLLAERGLPPSAVIERLRGRHAG